MKNVLYISWGSLSDNDMTDVMKRNGINITRLDWKMTDYDKDAGLEEKMLCILRKNSEIKRNSDIKESARENSGEKEKIDFVFSFNFLPVVSKVCQRAGVIYASWVYDSPHLTLYSKTVRNDKNFIFHFDSVEAERLKRYGCPHVFHLPLGVNADRLSGQTDRMGSGFADISFVGTLYTDNFYDSIASLPPELSGYLKGIMAVQKLVYGQDVVTPCLSRERMDEIKKYVSFSLNDNYEEDSQRIFADMFLLRKVTSMERIEIMERLFDEFSNVKLYTGSDVSALPKLKSYGKVDYEKEMPNVFYNSRINLNISLRTIQSGIPLRVMDIMGAGGFVLTNCQPELFEYFTPGEDFEYYESIEDLVGKCHYYLEHENERKRIAVNGMRKVRSEHSLDVKLGIMLGEMDRA